MLLIRTTIHLSAWALLVALLLLVRTASAQTSGQWVIQQKNAGAGFTLRAVTGTNSRAFGLDGSGNLTMLEVSGAGSTALDDLSDVTITTATTGQLLRYNGSAWVNYTHDFLTTATAANTYQPISGALDSIISASAGEANAIITADGADGFTAVPAGDFTGLSAEALTFGTLSDARLSANVSLLGQSIALATEVSGTLPIANGGTSATTAANARIALLPSMVGNGGKFLRVNAGATDYELATIGGGGDALTSGTLDQFADVTQTATKTLAITESTTLAGGTHSGTNTGDQTTITGNAGTATALQTARTINGTSFDGTANITITAAAGTLTGSTLASGVTASSLTSLGTIATGVWQGTAVADSYIASAATWNAKQAGDADLTTYAGITPAANVQSLLGAADYSAMRTLLGLVIGANVQAYDADLTTYAGITPAANTQSLLGAADYAAMRTLLGLVIGTNVQAYDADLADLADGSLTGTIVAAGSTSARGTVELATDGETSASVVVQGNDNRLVDAERVEIGLAISDETTAITTGTAKLTFRMPHAMTVTAVRMSLTTVSSSGTPTVDINEAGTTILSTKLSCDASEKTSTTAATAAVISDTALADDAEITIDIDTAGTGATGAKVWIIGTR